MTKYILDYYSILNINETSDKETIEEAYKKCILQYKSKSDNASDKKCKYIKDAYIVLSDDEKRAKYDLIRKNAQKNKKSKESRDKEDLGKVKDLLSDMNKNSGRSSKIIGSSAKAMRGKSLFGGGSKLLFGSGSKLLIGGAVAGYGVKKGRDYFRGRGKNNKNE